MFTLPTVFVIGAGAGSDIAMPVGSALSETIARKLDFTPDSGSKGGDPVIARMPRLIAQERSVDVNEWFAAGRSVAKGIRYTRSIDSYINSHRDDEKIKECAKLAIVSSILQCEWDSAVYFHEETGNWRADGQVHSSWLPTLMYLLQDKIVKGKNLKELFANFTIINFNYDRCIEQFLYYALQHLYRINENEAAELINAWGRIYHPYGSVGVLPWQIGGRKIGFGVRDYGDIWGLSQEIFTFNEQMNDAGSLRDARQAIQQAQRLIFLGFHFHQQNMDLLKADLAGPPVNIYATAVGRAAPEISVIHNQINVMIGSQRQRMTFDVLQNMRCTDLLNQYGTTLLR